jgi:hypothetical protein
MDERINKIAKMVGVKLSLRDPGESYMWDGETIGIGGLSDSNILHEIGHWQVSSEERRKLNDYGIGNGPDSRGYQVGILPYKLCMMEECLASLMGIGYEFHLGMDYMETMRGHSWIDKKRGEWYVVEDNDGLSFWAVVSKLEDMNLMKGGKPSILIGAK